MIKIFPSLYQLKKAILLPRTMYVRRKYKDKAGFGKEDWSRNVLLVCPWISFIFGWKCVLIASSAPWACTGVAV